MTAVVARRAAVVAAMLVIAAYAALLPGGRWQGDDYLGAALIGRGEWAIVIDSLKWGPRPLSTPLTWLYFAISHAVDRPLVTSFLAALWLACVAGVVRAGRDLGLAFILFALTLLLTQPGEMFYWPVGAAAYLPCWAGLAAATVQLRKGLAGIALAASLLVAVFSAEIGAITVLIYAALAGAMCVRDRQWRALLPLILPAMCAAAVCAQVLHTRMVPMHEVMNAGSGLAGHWGASFGAALPTFARALFGIEGLPLAAGVALKVCLAMGLAPAARAGSPLWAAALLLGAFASIVLAYHQFGALCCGRHASFRQGMIVMAMVVLAGYARIGWPVARQAGLAAALAVLLAVRARPLLADWRALPDVIAARQDSWQSGHAPGDAMTLFLAPRGQITNSDSLPPGHYERHTESLWGDGAWYGWGVMARFGKHSLVIEARGRKAVLF